MNVNPYAPPAHARPAVSRTVTHRTVRWCVGVASLIHAGWLTPAIYYIYRGGGIGFLKQNQVTLFVMVFAATVGGLATVGARRHRTWLAILMVWVPVAMYLPSAGVYHCWSSDNFRWYEALFVHVLLFAVSASPFAYAREHTPELESQSGITKR